MRFLLAGLMPLLIIVFLKLNLNVLGAGGLSGHPSVVAIRNVEQEKVNPLDGFEYLLKRLGEKVKLIFLSLSPSQKSAYYRELLARRLAELKFLIEKPEMAYFKTATIRYSTTAGMLTEYVLKNKDLVEERKKVVELLSSHLPVVEKLREVYDYDTAEWRFVKQDADYLQLYLAQLKD